MATKIEWIRKMMSEDAQDPNRPGNYVEVFAREYLEKFEVIDGDWVIGHKIRGEEYSQLYSEYQKVRNRFARLLRKDGWNIECRTFENIFGQTVIKLNGNRPIRKTIAIGVTV